MATLREVAEQAGVSIATASRALAGYSDVSAATRQRVISVARRLNYTPNVLAQNLVRKQSSFFGLYLDDEGLSLTKQPFFLPVICGVRDAAAAEGLHMLFLARSGKGSLVATARMTGVSGLIVMGLVEDDPELKALAEAEVPTVAIDIAPVGNAMGAVTSDNERQARLMTLHLLDQGYRRILFVGGKPNTTVHRLREQGYRKALLERGFPPEAARVVLGHFDRERAFDAVREALREGDVDAVFAASDLMAEGALMAVKEAGYRVPEEIGVAGFDDLEIARLVDPPLTTVRQDPVAMGDAALRLLRRLVTEKEVMARIVEIPGELVIRRSTLRSGAGRRECAT